MTSENKKAKMEIEDGSGNIFADLGLENADELYTRSQLGLVLLKLLKQRKLSQREIATVLDIKQSAVLQIMNGHFSGFTMDDLFGFLKRIDQKIVIGISPHHNDEPYQQVVLET